MSDRDYGYACPAGHAVSIADSFCRHCGSRLFWTCPNGHPVEDGDARCDRCGAGVVPSRGSALGPGGPSAVTDPSLSRSAVRPSTAAGATTQTELRAAPTDGAGGLGPHQTAGGSELSAHRARLGLIVAGVAVVGMGVILGGLLAGSSGGGAAHGPHTGSDGRPSPSTKAPVSTAGQRAYASFLQRIENVVQQSQAARHQLGQVLNAISSHCAEDLNEASQQIQAVIDTRNSLLVQLSALSVPPNTDNAQAFFSLLQQSLQSSINADIQYKSWINSISGTYDYVACPGGAPPPSGAHITAGQNDVNSGNLKSQFAAEFNAAAARAGLPPVDPTAF